VATLADRYPSTRIRPFLGFCRISARSRKPERDLSRQDDGSRIATSRVQALPSPSATTFARIWVMSGFAPLVFSSRATVRIFGACRRKRRDARRILPRNDFFRVFSAQCRPQQNAYPLGRLQPTKIDDVNFNLLVRVNVFSIRDAHKGRLMQMC